MYHENSYLVKKEQKNAGHIFLLRQTRLPIRKSHLTKGNL